MELIITQLFNGLVMGVTLALISVGLTIIYGALGVVNFAHGAMFVLGAYIGYAAYGLSGSLAIAVLTGAAGVAAVGFVIERELLRRYYTRPAEDQILVTFGLAIIIVELIRTAFGGSSRTIPAPLWGPPVLHVFNIAYPTYRVVVLGIGILTLAVIYIGFYKTSLGLIVRAGIEDRKMVSALALPIERIISGVFVFGVMTAGYAGVVYAPITELTPDMGFRFLISGFVVVVVGGVGSFLGAIGGALLVGILTSLTAIWDPRFGDIVMFAMMATVLTFRPRGLFS